MKRRLIITFVERTSRDRDFLVESVVEALKEKNFAVAKVQDGGTEEGAAMAAKARDRECHAVRILNELCVLKEEVRQCQKRTQHWSSMSPERGQARRDLRLAKEAFERRLHSILGAWA